MIYYKKCAAGGGPLPAKTLNSVWSSLKEREQAVLRVMAETIKPESVLAISDYLAWQFNFNKVNKALKTLRSLNLLVVKRRPNGPDLLELHPLVRAFIRKSFTQNERVSYINQISKIYRISISKLKERLSDRPPLSVLQQWTQAAELDIAAGRIQDAFSVIAEVADAFMTSAYPRELARVARLLLSGVDWVTEHPKYDQFELVFKSNIRSLAHLGEIEEVDFLLSQYEQTVPHRDARYIGYCEMRCYVLWFRSAFSEAVEWGGTARRLLEASSGLDSKFAHLMMHTLALVERDAGHPEIALETFLDGRALTDVIDPDELDEQRGEHFTGMLADVFI